MTTRTRTLFTCQHCGTAAPKWSGQCPGCQEWNCLSEEIIPKESQARYQGYATGEPVITPIAGILLSAEPPRHLTGSSELDRVLGGGLVTGSVVLTGGSPGIGKSTLLLQALCHLGAEHEVLYVTGEESAEQVALRARRLDLPLHNLNLLTDTQIEHILKLAKKAKPRIIVIDSIQTMHTDLLASAPGSVGQVRESAAQLVKYAKQTGTALFLIGHVTKEGTLAGPRVLEHMVDTVLYFDGEQDGRHRWIRAVKNRFGPVNELGIFVMTDRGLKGVTNPSAIFLSRFEKPVSGSVITATREGSRPLLVEIQALVDDNDLPMPRRVSLGLDAQRLAMLLAVLHKHCGISTASQDIFINAVGGVRITETASDLALLAAVLSSLRDKPIPQDVVIFGEVGLAGEIRPVQAGQDRLREAAKHGFTRAIIPKANAPREAYDGLQIYAAQTLAEAVEHIKGL